jgi:hypothetical protein
MSSNTSLYVDPKLVVVNFACEQSDQPPWTSARPHRLNLTIDNGSAYDLVDVTLDPYTLTITGDASKCVSILNTVPIQWTAVSKNSKGTAPDANQPPGGRAQLFVKVDDTAPPMTTFTIGAVNALTYTVKADQGNTGTTGPIMVNP